MTPSRQCLGLAILGLALAGCGGTFTTTSLLDVERFEGTLVDGITEQTGTVIESVDCPDEVTMETGNEFECSVTDDQGNTGSVEVTQGEDGDTSWILAGGIAINMSRLEETIREGLETQLGATIPSVECPEGIVIEAGNDFECTATDDAGATGVVAVTQHDDAGNITWELEQ